MDVDWTCDTHFFGLARRDRPPKLALTVPFFSLTGSSFRSDSGTAPGAPALAAASFLSCLAEGDAERSDLSPRLVVLPARLESCRVGSVLGTAASPSELRRAPATSVLRRWLSINPDSISRSYMYCRTGSVLHIFFYCI